MKWLQGLVAQAKKLSLLRDLWLSSWLKTLIERSQMLLKPRRWLSRQIWCTTTNKRYENKSQNYKPNNSNFKKKKRSALFVGNLVIMLLNVETDIKLRKPRPIPLRLIWRKRWNYCYSYFSSEHYSWYERMNGRL